MGIGGGVLVHQCTSTMRLVVCLLVLVLAVHSTLAISEVEVGDTATTLQGRVRGEDPLQDRVAQGRAKRSANRGRRGRRGRTRARNSNNGGGGFNFPILNAI